MGDYMPRKELPANIRIADAQRQRRKKKNYPKWFFNERILSRIMGVYADYVDHKTLPEIQAAHGGISLTQIYADIDKGRYLQKLNLQEDAEQIIGTAVARRQRVVRDCDREIQSLREGLEIGVGRANAIANLLRTKSEEQTKIEELQGLRKRGGKIDQLDDEDGDPGKGTTVVFDMSKITIGGQAGPEPFEGQVLISDGRGT